MGSRATEGWSGLGAIGAESVLGHRVDSPLAQTKEEALAHGGKRSGLIVSGDNRWVAFGPSRVARMARYKNRSTPGAHVE